MNLVTVPPYRRRGIARRVMRAMLQWLMDHGIQVIALHASEGGRPLYQELGFAPSNEMRLKINELGFPPTKALRPAQPSADGSD